MPNIAVINTKGGTCKTTTCMYLAVAASRDGTRANVIDTDMQGGATTWYNAIKSEVGDPGFDCTLGNQATLGGLNRKRLNIIDTAPGDAMTIQKAIDVADLIILSTTDALADLDRTWKTLRTTASTPTVVLMNKVKLNTTLYRLAREQLAESDTPAFQTPILLREEIKQTYYSMPKKLFGYDDVYNDVKGVLA